MQYLVLRTSSNIYETRVRIILHYILMIELKGCELVFFFSATQSRHILEIKKKRPKKHPVGTSRGFI